MMFEKDKTYLKQNFIYRDDLFSKEYATAHFYYTMKFIILYPLFRLLGWMDNL